MARWGPSAVSEIELKTKPHYPHYPEKAFHEQGIPLDLSIPLNNIYIPGVKKMFMRVILI